MKKRLSIAISILFLCCFAVTKVTSCETWTPGVAKGDFFCYQMYAVYTSSDPNAIIEVPPFERNNTDWVRIDITGTSGSIVYQVYTLHLKNGTESKFDWQTDLNPEHSENLSFKKKGVPICAANLEAGDQLPTAQLCINKTLTIVYPSGERETNCVSWNSPDDWGYCYFDQKTGVLVQLYRVHSYVNSQSGRVTNKTDVLKMTNSNLWRASAMPIFELPRSFIFSS
jgi:hypothetical protein